MNMIRRIKVLLLALLGCCLWPVGAVLGTEYTVTMTDYYAFTPSYLEIQVNDVVTWVNQDEYDSHDSVSDDGYWNSGPLYYRDKASLQFPFEGTFGYHDSISQPSHRLTGLSTKKALASVWLRATRHGCENKKPRTKANEA